MTQIQIDITEYLSSEEIKEACIEQLKCEVSKHFRTEENAKRLLANLSYQIVFDEVDKTIENSRGIIESKTKAIIDDFSNYNVFRDSSYGTPKSLAYQIMENAVSENKDLINEKVKDTITNKDYSKEIWTKFEQLGETFISNIYEIVSLGRKEK